MSKTKEDIKATTVCVDVAERDYINGEADRLGLSQRQMVRRLTETYRNFLKALEAKGEKTSEEISLRDMYENLDKVLKRDDRVVAFIKEQEKILLNPILKTVLDTEARLNQLIEILSNLE
jgi:predicted transcriptional regulator